LDIKIFHDLLEILSIDPDHYTAKHDLVSKGGKAIGEKIERPNTKG
jgi:hypothetical protein